MTLGATNLQLLSSRLATMTGIGAIAMSSLVGCSKDEPEETIDPLNPPPPEQVEIPDTPHDRLGECFDPRGFTGIKFSATDAMYPGGAPVDGDFITELDRQSFCLTGDPCARDLNGDEFKLQSDDPSIVKLEGLLRWASIPWSLHADNPDKLVFGDLEYTEASKRVGDRVSGEPLAKLKFSQNGLFVSWGDDVYPDYANSLGLIYFVNGAVDLNDCSYEFSIYPGVKTINGHELAGVDLVPLPIYEGSDGLATTTMSNENIVMVPQGFTIRGSDANQPVTIDVGDATVGNLQGELVIEERRTSDGGAVTMHEEPVISDSPDAGGIPPLDPPDAGN